MNRDLNSDGVGADIRKSIWAFWRSRGTGRIAEDIVDELEAVGVEKENTVNTATVVVLHHASVKIVECVARGSGKVGGNGMRVGASVSFVHGFVRVNVI